MTLLVDYLDCFVVWGESEMSVTFKEGWTLISALHLADVLKHFCLS